MCGVNPESPVKYIKYDLAVNLWNKKSSGRSIFIRTAEKVAFMVAAVLVVMIITLANLIYIPSNYISSYFLAESRASLKAGEQETARIIAESEKSRKELDEALEGLRLTNVELDKVIARSLELTNREAVQMSREVAELRRNAVMRAMGRAVPRS